MWTSASISISCPATVDKICQSSLLAQSAAVVNALCWNASERENVAASLVLYAHQQNNSRDLREVTSPGSVASGGTAWERGCEAESATDGRCAAHIWMANVWLCILTRDSCLSSNTAPRDRRGVQVVVSAIQAVTANPDWLLYHLMSV